MKIKLLMLGAASATLLFSCEKEKTIQECESEFLEEVNFMPLKDGNYWVYESKTIDTLGNIVSTSLKHDTVTVVNDTVIGGITYKKLKITFNNLPLALPTYLREKDTELLTPSINSTSGLFEGDEQIIFSIFKDTLSPLACLEATWAPNCAYQIAKVIFPQTENITVPVGSFYVKKIQEVIIKNDNGIIGWPFWGTKRVNDNQFANKIGMIRREIFPVATTNTNVAELISYHLN